MSSSSPVPDVKAGKLCSCSMCSQYQNNNGFQEYKQFVHATASFAKKQWYLSAIICPNVFLQDHNHKSPDGDWRTDVIKLALEQMKEDRFLIRVHQLDHYLAMESYYGIAKFFLPASKLNDVIPSSDSQHVISIEDAEADWVWGISSVDVLDPKVQAHYSNLHDFLRSRAQCKRENAESLRQVPGTTVISDEATKHKDYVGLIEKCLRHHILCISEAAKRSEQNSSIDKPLLRDLNELREDFPDSILGAASMKSSDHEEELLIICWDCPIRFLVKNFELPRTKSCKDSLAQHCGTERHTSAVLSRLLRFGLLERVPVKLSRHMQSRIEDMDKLTQLGRRSVRDTSCLTPYFAFRAYQPFEPELPTFVAFPDHIISRQPSENNSSLVITETSPSTFTSSPAAATTSRKRQKLLPPHSGEDSDIAMSESSSATQTMSTSRRSTANVGPSGTITNSDHNLLITLRQHNDEHCIAFHNLRAEIEARKKAEDALRSEMNEMQTNMKTLIEQNQATSARLEALELSNLQASAMDSTFDEFTFTEDYVYPDPTA